MNMTFRKSILGAVVLALGTVTISALPALAQDTPPAQQDQAGPPQGGRGNPAQREEHQLQFLTKKLSLTPDQVSQVKAIDDETRQQMMALRNDSSVTGQDRHAKMMDIHKASQDKIRGVLTDDQKTKYDALQAEMQQRMQERRSEQGAPAAPPQ